MLFNWSEQDNYHGVQWRPCHWSPLNWHITRASFYVESSESPQIELLGPFRLCLILVYCFSSKYRVIYHCRRMWNIELLHCDQIKSAKPAIESCHDAYFVITGATPRVVPEVVMTTTSFRWITKKPDRLPSSLSSRHNENDGISNHQPQDCLLNCLFRHRSKKTSKLCITGFCVGNTPATVEFPAQRASNAENVSIWWCHQVSDPSQTLFV